MAELVEYKALISTIDNENDSLGTRTPNEVSEGAAWWDTVASIDTSQIEVIQFLEAYILEAGKARQSDRRNVVERFLLWQQGFTFGELAKSSGISSRVVQRGVRQVGLALMGTPLPNRKDLRKVVKEKPNLTEEQWRQAVLDNGFVSAGKADYIPEDDGPFSWQRDGLCGQTDPDAFIVDIGGSSKAAEKVCVSCDAQLACLAFALMHDLGDGSVYGGMNQRRRRLFRNKVLRQKTA